MKLEDRMSRSIKQRTSIVVLRSDFSKMGSDSQVGRVLARFVENGVLVRVSKGAFAKARIRFRRKLHLHLLHQVLVHRTHQVGGVFTGQT